MPDAHAKMSVSLSPATTGQLKTNLLQRAGAEAVQTVEQREDVKQAEDVDPLKSFHLCRHTCFTSTQTSPLGGVTQGRSLQKTAQPVPTHLLFSAAGFSFQHLQQASGGQRPGRVHKHHALFQMVRDVNAGSKTHLRRP